MMRASCLAMATLALMASRADAAIIDWQAELQRCRVLRQNVAPLLQAGEGISAVGRSNRSVRRCIGSSAWRCEENPRRGGVVAGARQVDWLFCRSSRSFGPVG